MLIIGHRGARGYAPENTLRSFKKAVGLGAQGVELDVHLSKDKKLIVIHDNDVSRTTRGKGLVSQITLEEIKKIDAGSGERIPTLEEVIDLLAGKNILLNIELKGLGTVVPAVKLIEQKRITNQVVISSFLYNKLRIAKNLNPKIKTGILIRKLPRRLADFLKLAKTHHADGFHIRHNFLKKKYLAAAHQNNLYIWAWTVNSSREIKKFKSWGVDGLITNYPDRAL
jgi:glycerophosphoryl diester phosphodiesterase